MSKSIGIDLGTTNTAVAVVVDGRPKVLEDEKGYKVLPSCVSSKGDGRYVIGQAAKNLILSAPDATVYAIKRLIGRRFDSPEVVRTSERVGFRIQQASDGGVLVGLGDEFLSPAEASSIILQVARQIAERALGESVEEAVITVPAYFTHAQREATLEAARMTGLRCERLINEPTAAALAYGYRKDLDRQLVIFDLGGGTFDVCVLRISNGVYEIQATRGDSFLGGEDFDFRLVDHLSDHFQTQHGVDLREDRTALQRLKDAAERAKCELSFTDRTTVLIPRILDDTSLEMVVSRQTLEALVDDLVSRTIDVTQRTLSDAGIAVGQIDDVILVGGQTRMPKVREALSGFLGREPNRSVHPEEVVAVGAAVHANTLVDPAESGSILLDVTPFDLGIDSVGGMFAPVIPRNTKIPTSRTRIFSTVHENQDRVRVTVRQGEQQQAEENEFLGEFIMEGITPMPAMEAKVNVSFRLDANGMLHVQATEAATGERKQITIRNYAEIASQESSAKAVRPDLTGDVQRDRGLLTSDEPKPDLEEALAPEEEPETDAAGKEQVSRFSSFLGRMFGGRGKTQEKPKQVGDEAAQGASAQGAKEKAVKLVGDAQSGSPAPRTSPEPELDADEAGKAYSDIQIDLPTGVDDNAVEDVSVADLEDADLDMEPLEATAPASLGMAGEALAAGDMPFTEDEGDLWDDEGEQEADDLPVGDLGEDDLLALPDDLEDELPMWGSEDEDDTVVKQKRARPSPPSAPPAGSSTDESAPKGATPRKKPARLKMNYKSAEAFLLEYRENLRRGGAFIRTPKPLPLGRECIFEVRAPQLEAPLVFPGVVTWSSQALATLSAGQEQGMGIEYRMDDATLAKVERVLAQMEKG